MAWDLGKGVGWRLALLACLGYLSASVAQAQAQSPEDGALLISGASRYVLSVNPNTGAGRVPVAGTSSSGVSDVSRDGKWIASTQYVEPDPPDPDISDKNDVFIRPYGATNAVNVTNTQAFHETGPVFSPDGTRVAAFAEFGAIYVFNRDGSDYRVILDDSFYDIRDIFWASNDYLYVSEGNGQGTPSAIYLLHRTGAGGLVPLYTYEDNIGWVSDVSRDGEKFLLYDDKGRDGAANDLYVFDLATESRTLVAKNLSQAIDGAIFSPSGTQVAYEDEVGSRSLTLVYAANADGSNRRLLSCPVSFGFSPTEWTTLPSPTATKTPFMSVRRQSRSKPRRKINVPVQTCTEPLSVKAKGKLLIRGAGKSRKFKLPTTEASLPVHASENVSLAIPGKLVAKIRAAERRGLKATAAYTFKARQTNGSGATIRKKHKVIFTR